MENHEKEVILEFSLPGYRKEDIKMILKKNSIEIKAKHEIEKKVQRQDFFHDEKTAKHFEYSSTLPIVNPNKAKISFKDGILRIVLPKV